MLKEFKNLSPDEQQLFFDAIPLITILVAGADDDIDEVELEEAQRLADIRSFNNAGHLTAYYELLQENLSTRIQELSRELPNAVEPRQQEIASRLARFNEIFPKMALPFAYLYYRDFVSFAKHVAESHGGFMRFMTVGPDEAKVMHLPMLTPVERPSKVDYPDLP
ncbi:hypothetical protein QWY85_15445 [Neolewinella lacunae]|uniref:Uncharacterized protein n=1 Tax=Neolewinella lacunae TaxID=1517758 RepID=A0A923PHB1_9BACT|nr:hypothetical protein [Neolewinella lacunae]MBC6994067.1 hypothetical protein [Neolewinella lacunae]MDN3636062.1 hypothetical protein [Neolewinella lacunae]